MGFNSGFKGLNIYGVGDVDQIYLFKYRDRWLRPVSMVMKRVELELLRATGFLRKTLIYGFPVEMPE